MINMQFSELIEEETQINIRSNLCNLPPTVSGFITALLQYFYWVYCHFIAILAFFILSCWTCVFNMVFWVVMPLKSIEINLVLS